jgi:hypothetical protein
VATLDPADAWAVGNSQGGGSINALIEHWNGVSWQAAALPASIADGVVLNAVTALGPRDLWAAGLDEYTNTPVLLHGDGRTWRQVALPGAGISGAYGEYGEINALVPDDAGGVYVVGSAYLTNSAAPVLVPARSSDTETVRPSHPALSGRRSGVRHYAIQGRASRLRPGTGNALNCRKTRACGATSISAGRQAAARTAIFDNTSNHAD